MCRAFQPLIRNMSSQNSVYPIDGNLIVVLHQLFAAGSDTTSTTLRWAVLLMAQNLDVQRKVHEEIDAVIGV